MFTTILKSSVLASGFSRNESGNDVLLLCFLLSSIYQPILSA